MTNVPNAPGVPPLNSYSDSSVQLLSADALLAVSLVLPQGWGIFFQGLPVILPASVATQVITSALAPVAQVASLLGLPNLLPVFASTIEFDFDQEWAIADYPIESGGFFSYDKVQLPFDIRVKLASGGTVTQRQAFLNSIFAIAGGSPLGSASLLSTALSAVTGGAISTGALSSAASSLTGGILTGLTTPPLFDIVTPEGSYASCSCRRVSFGRRSYEGVTLITADLSFVQIRQTSTSSYSNTAIPGIAGQSSTGNVQPTAPSSSISTGFTNAGGSQ